MEVLPLQFTTMRSFGCIRCHLTKTCQGVPMASLLMPARQRVVLSWITASSPASRGNIQRPAASSPAARPGLARGHLQGENSIGIARTIRSISGMR
eukprot:symbB.v1.2.022299.t1/scaffold1973.1/size94122/3